MAYKLMNHPTYLPYLVGASLLASMAALPGCSRETADSLISSAKVYLEKKDSKAAVIQLKNVLLKDPNSAEARFLLGRALLESDDPASAVLELRKSLELKYPSEKVAPVLVRALNAQSQFKKVIDEFASIDVKDPAGRADLKTSLAIAYAGQGQLEQARASLESALQAAPEYVPALLLQVRMKAASGDADAGLTLLDKVLQKEPAHVDAWQLKGDLLLAAKEDGAGALQAYGEALKVKKDYWPAHAGVMSIYLSRKDLAEAEKGLDRLKEVLPNHPQTKYFNAVLALQKKDYAMARALSQQLLKIAPGNIRAQQLAGSVELQSGSLIQAEKYFAQVLQSSPEHLPARLLLAQTYLRTGQPAKTLTTLEPVLEQGKPDAGTLALAAQAHLQSGDNTKAEALFKKAAALNPKDVASRTGLALSNLAKGNVEIGLDELKGVAASDSGTTADMALISAHLQRRDFDRALKAIDDLEKKQSSNPLAATLRGRVHLARKDMTAARQSFERASAIDPLYFSAADNLAALDVADGKPDAAKKRFEPILAANPKHLQALLAVARLRLAAGGSREEVAALLATAAADNPAEAAPRVLLIELHLKYKDVKTALVMAQDAVAGLPDSAQLLEVLGRVQMAAGAPNQALSSFSKLATLQPRSAHPHILLADSHVALKNPDAAAQSLKRALETAPDSLPAQQRLIALQVANGRLPAALAIARSVQRQRVDDSVGYLFEGDIEASAKHWDAAANAYRAGLKRQPATYLAVKLHALLLAAGQKDDAAKFSAAWRRDHGQDAAFLYHLGEVALGESKYPAAEENYLAVTRLRPTDAAAFNNLAWVMTKQQKKGALAYAEKANALLPGQPALLDTLALALAAEDQLDKAIAVQLKAVDLQPENPALRLNLAKLYIKAIDKPRARTELDRLAKLGSTFADQAQVSQLLKEL